MDTKGHSVKRKIFGLVLGIMMVLPASVFLSGGAYADGEGGDDFPPIPPDWEESPVTTPPPDVELPMADDDAPLPPIDDDFNHTIPGIPEYEEIEPEMPELISTPIPDLIVSDMTLAEYPVPLNTEAELHIVLENIGIAYVEEIEVAYYLDEMSPATLLAVEITYFEEFSSEQTVFLNMAELGDHTILALIDPYDSIAEVREDNNELSVGIEIVSIDSLVADATAQIEVLKTETTNLLGAKKGKAIIAHLNFIENKLADAVSFYDSGKTTQAVNAINNAVDRAFLVVEKYESLYLKGELSETDAIDLMLAVENLTKTMVTMTDIAVDTPLSYSIASIEQVVAEVRIEGTIQAMGNVYWDEIDNELAVILNYYQTAMFKLAKGQNSDIFLDNADAALIALIEVIEAYGAEGWISPELAEWTVGKIEDSRAISPADLTIEPADIHIDELASHGKTSVLTVKVWNLGGVDANDVTVTLYDEMEDVEIGAGAIATVPNGGYGEADVYWTPTQVGTHYVRAVVDQGNQVIESDEGNNEARNGFYVVAGTTFLDSVYIPPGLTRWDPSNESIDDTVVVSGNITIDGLLLIQGITVVMNCTVDNEYKIQVNDSGKINAIDSNFTSPSQTLTYRYMIINGALDLISSTVQWVWGVTSGDVYSPGGIQLYSDNIFIVGSEIFEGKTHGIYVGFGSSPNFISGNTIRDNDVTGICYEETAGGTIDDNRIINSTYGVYCYQASPTISNNPEILGNTNSGIFCDWASPTITGNTIKDNNYGIYFRLGSNSLASANTIENNINAGIWCDETPVGVSPTIQNNPSISNSPYGIYAYKSSPTINGNTFFDNAEIGVMAHDSTSLITRNTLVNNNYSVEHYLSPAGLVTSWNIIKDSYCGVYSYGSSGSRIENNTEIADNDYGVYFQESPDVVVENNVINASTEIGIFANFSERTTIRNCSMENNTCGIVILSSSYSTITDNCAIIGGNGTYVAFSSNIEMRDSTIRGSGNYGIYFTLYTTFSTIDNCTVENKEWGVFISSSHNIVVSNCTASSNRVFGVYFLKVNNSKTVDSKLLYDTGTGWGALHIRKSSDCIVNNCEFRHNGNLTPALAIDLSTNITVTNNVFENNRWINLFVGTWWMSGEMNKFHYCHNIDTSNTVNGKPIYYFFDLEDQVIENLEGGHFTFAWCDNITVRHCNSTGTGLSVADPIYLVYTNNSQVDTCLGLWTTDGLWLYKTDNITVTDFEARRAYWAGILIEDSSNCSFTRYDIKYCCWGVYVQDSVKILMQDTRVFFSQHNTLDTWPIIGKLVEGIRIERSSEIMLDNCTSTASRGGGFNIIYSDHITLNNSKTGVYRGFTIADSAIVKLENCTSVDNSWGIRAVRVTDITVKDYVAQKCTYSIEFYAVTRPSVFGCEVITDKANAVGIRVQDSVDGILEDCEIGEHRWGILVRSSDNITVSGADIEFGGPGIPGAPPMSGISYGIDIGDQTSHTHVKDCEVKGTHYAVAVRNSTINCTIDHTILTETESNGVYLSSSKLEAWNITITDTNESAVQSYDSVFNITNSSISASNIYDFYLDLDSNITTLNTTFNKALVQYFDTESTLTIKWFMHVHVVDPTFNLIPGAYVTVEDVNDVPILSDFAIDGTYRWIVCTEYIQDQTVTTHDSPYNVSATFGPQQGWAMPEAPMEMTSDVYVMLGDDLYSIYLHEGWNLISLPYKPDDMGPLNLGVVLSSIDGKWDYVEYYDTEADHWMTNSTYKPWSLNDLTHLNHTMGFWLNVIEPCTLLVTGELQTSTPIQLEIGWNLVGYPTTDRTTDISTAFVSIDAFRDDTPVEGYNASAPYLISPLPETYIMQPGEGYWVHVTDTCTWTVDW